MMMLYCAILELKILCSAALDDARRAQQNQPGAAAGRSWRRLGGRAEASP